MNKLSNLRELRKCDECKQNVVDEFIAPYPSIFEVQVRQIVVSRHGTFEAAREYAKEFFPMSGRAVEIKGGLYCNSCQTTRRLENRDHLPPRK